MRVWLLYVKQSADCSAASKSLRSSMHSHHLRLLSRSVGRDILVRQQAEGWRTKVIDRLAKDLQTEFPGVEGFSPRSLKYMRSFAEALGPPYGSARPVQRPLHPAMVISVPSSCGAKTRSIQPLAIAPRGMLGTRAVFMNRTIRLFHHICSRDLAAVAQRDPSGVARINCYCLLLVSKGAGCMLARDFDGIAFGLRARLRLIERRALRGLGIVLRVFRFYGLHAGLRFFGRIGHS
jgi:DUF1016 N-terminal domain